MLSFKQYIVEKRKNPEQNPKISTLQKIKQYAKMDDVYVSFRSINKLGINPKSSYSTPNGIYCYWLKSYRSSLNDVGNTDAPNIVFPYMAKPVDTEHFYLFKAKENANVVKLGDMTESDVKQYMLKYIGLYPEIRMKFIDQENLNLIKKFEQELTQSQNLLKKGEEYLVNNLKEIPFIIKKEKNVTNQLKSIEDSLKRELYSLKQSMPDFSDEDKFVDYIYKMGTKEAVIHNIPGGIFWWFGYYLYGNVPNKWNKFFRDLGIHAMTDDKGLGIIHSNEPYQTVFFDGSKIKTIDSGYNKVYKKSIKIGRLKYYYEEENGVRVYSNINISEMYLPKIPNFGDNYIVTGRFDCSGNNFTNLEGGPNSVGGDFNCRDNELTTLEGSPSSVGGDFYCKYNKKQFTEEEIREVCDVKGTVYI